MIFLTGKTEHLRVKQKAEPFGSAHFFSDLLMSITSANWKKIDARKEIDRIVTEIYGIGRPGFLINKDFVLKTFLVPFVDNIRFQLKNFTYENLQLFEANWDKVKKSLQHQYRKLTGSSLLMPKTETVFPICSCLMD